MTVSANDPHDAGFDVRILIVEDERLLAEELRERLTMVGATVVGSVVSGPQAIAAAEQLRPDLVLMDIRLKGEMDGIEAATQISRTLGTPIVFLTAHSDHMTVERAKSASPYGYILKPVQEHELRITLSLAMHRVRLERSLRDAEMRLREAQKLEAVGRLAGGVAHDVNNMMTVVSGYAEMLLSQLPENDPNRGLVEELKQAGDRTAGITRQLLSFSRHRIARPRLANVTDLLASIEGLLAQVLPPGITLRRLTHVSRAQIRVDPGQFEQIVLNLVLNARDAMPRGGTLTIETSVASLDASWDADDHERLPAGDYVLVTVTDTGGGIAPEISERIFEPFFSTKADGHGTGLGLAVVRDMVRAAGGQVLLYSEPGHGSSFTLYFPRASEEEGEALPQRQDGDDKDLRAEGAPVVLLAEDEDSGARLTRTLLEQQGYTVLAACDGEDALAVAAAHTAPIDMVLTDVGHAPARRTRARAPARRGASRHPRAVHVRLHRRHGAAPGHHARRPGFPAEAVQGASTARRRSATCCGAPRCGQPAGAPT